MLNQCQFIGNLGADPEIRRTQDGRPIANLSLAVTESWKDKNTGEKKERTEWVRSVIFSEGLCRVAEAYLRKGAKVFISGKMQTRKWQDSNGNDKWTTEVVLQGFDAKLVMLGERQAQQPDPTSDDYLSEPTIDNYNGQPSSDHLDDEVPF